MLHCNVKSIGQVTVSLYEQVEQMALKCSDVVHLSIGIRCSGRRHFPVNKMGGW